MLHLQEQKPRENMDYLREYFQTSISVRGNAQNDRRAGSYLIGCIQACSIRRLGIIHVYNESVIPVKHIPPYNHSQFLIVHSLM